MQQLSSTCAVLLGLLLSGAFGKQPFTSLMQDDKRTWLWWICLLALTIYHLGATVREARALDLSALPSSARCVVACSLTFAVGALLRTLFPVRWGSRPHACLYDVPYDADFLGSDLFDRITANIAEMSMGMLIAQSAAIIHASLGFPRLAAISRLLLWPIALAQCFCWWGGSTDNKLAHVIEESLWGGTFAVHAALTVTGWAGTFGGGKNGESHDASTLRRQRNLYLVSLVPCACYVYFMCARPRLLTHCPAAAACTLDIALTLVLTLWRLHWAWRRFAVDVPMYYEQWRADETRGVVYDSFLDGLRRMATCQDFSDTWGQWSEDAVWMSGYFGIAPFINRALVRVATNDERRPTIS